ncbi:MAG: hypothetical protein COU11_04270 [Candidatus Harrisonbacteria bacterium CG10_big_fil_rev_8_21_14_0_10_49_15]|uniref:Aminoacyl-tRNA hydrolase n=1 Tax=Candidatus Harrisonbacteria bacterium CG10_big_fil_rev_8_21_14_0_10_49_15 TaxID=1974587 RepID=A0A2H0UJW9_9BACT|nr:MAG: hypothetical protein COU11_04270 [Candidatus Harrisonbacteria bacterium CG10_big_fil_rev_8_21_14_0_10_49_15]
MKANQGKYDIKLVVGLGNDGTRYAKTYHNVGRFVAKILEEKNTESPQGWSFFNPPGFMNTSGVAISQKLRQSPLKPESLLVIHDDSDQIRGNFKIVFGGNSGGHNGIESLIEHLGTKDFWRLKIGIREPVEVTRKKAEEFVLAKWSVADEELFRMVGEQAWILLNRGSR